MEVRNAISTRIVGSHFADAKLMDCNFSPLPEDIWYTLSEYYLSIADIANLSLVCRRIRKVILLILFSHISFYADQWELDGRERYEKTMIRLHYSRHHVTTFLQNADFLLYVKSIEIKTGLLSSIPYTT